MIFLLEATHVIIGGKRSHSLNIGAKGTPFFVGISGGGEKRCDQGERL